MLTKKKRIFLRNIDSDATKMDSVADEMQNATEEVNPNTNGRNSEEMSTTEAQNTTEMEKQELEKRRRNGS